MYNHSRTFAMILIGLGVFILANKLGFVFGHTFRMLWHFMVPTAMVVLGYIGMRNGRWLVGGILFTIGLMVILAKLSGLFIPVIAVGMIVLGIARLRGTTRPY